MKDQSQNELEQDVSIDAPIIQSHNDYLVNQTKAIKQRSVPWQGYQKASLITEEELQKIENYQKTSKESPELFIELLSKLSKVDTLQQILVFLDELLESTELSQDLNIKLKDLLFNLLVKEDDFIQIISAKLITKLEQTHCTANILPFLNWLSFQLLSSDINIIDTVLQLLQTLLANDQRRIDFYNHENITKKYYRINSLLNILKNDKFKTSQIQYQAIYIIWLLSFNIDIAKSLQERFVIFQLLTLIALESIKEKTVRIIIQVFKNLLLKAPQENIIPMLAVKTLNTLTLLKQRKWTDEELLEDIQFIETELQGHVDSLTTFEEYREELRGMVLEDSPTHQSELFWKMNASRLEQNQQELLKILLKICKKEGTKIEELKIALHDLGQYSKFASGSKEYLVLISVLKALGGKEIIMELMGHKDESVRYEALLCIQKVMMNSF